jgi:transposase
MWRAAKSGFMSHTRRYPTDLIGRRWSIVERLLPRELPRAPGGRPPEHSKRKIVNVMLYHVRAGGA